MSMTSHLIIIISRANNSKCYLPLSISFLREVSRSSAMPPPPTVSSHVALFKIHRAYIIRIKARSIDFLFSNSLSL